MSNSAEIVWSFTEGIKGKRVLPYRDEKVVLSVIAARESRPNKVYMLDFNSKEHGPLIFGWQYLYDMAIVQDSYFLRPARIFTHRVN